MSVRGNGWQCNKESNLHVPQTSSTNNRKFLKQSKYLVTWCLVGHVKKQVPLLQDMQRVCCCVFLSLKGSQCWQALKSSFWSLDGSSRFSKLTIQGWVPWVYPYLFSFDNLQLNGVHPFFYQHCPGNSNHMGWHSAQAPSSSCLWCRRASVST